MFDNVFTQNVSQSTQMLLAAIITIVALYVFAKLVLVGPDLSMYDSPTGDWYDDHPDDKAATKETIALFKEIRRTVTSQKSLTKVFNIMRTYADELSKELETDSQFKPVVVDGVNCEWTIRDGADESIRILFLHGGAFLMGSPKGHRAFTDQLAKITNGVVLSVDYRLLPENRRHASVEDAQTAYKWLLKNSPTGEKTLEKLIIAGDSAGGNLALMLSSWSDGNADKRPDAVLAFSPNADQTLASPTIKQNQKTDQMLGEGLGLLAKLPLTLRVLISSILMRCNTANPMVSPLFADLSNLPPTLIHASSSEMLLGDAIRYTNRARVSGSNVKLQIWRNQMHDWHLMNIGKGSANTAWTEVTLFLNEYLN